MHISRYSNASGKAALAKFGKGLSRYHRQSNPRRIHKATRQIVAIKIIDLDDAEDEIDDVQQEISVLSQIHDCDQVTKYFGAYVKDTKLWIGTPVYLRGE
jgi:hypothetical protein